MKIFSELTFTILLLISSIFTTSSQSQFDNALLWKISGNGLTQPSYIFGTHHLASPDFLDNITGFKNALESTDQVVGELIITPAAKTEMQIKMQQAAMMPEGQSYTDILSADDYKKLDDGLNALFKTGLNSFGKFKPGMISMLYSIILYSMAEPGFNPNTHEPLDAIIQVRGEEMGKTILGLETIEDQIYALFESETMEDQIQTLICGLENVDWSKDAMTNINKLYKEKALAKIYDLAFNNNGDPCPTSLKMQSALNEDRNKKWLEKLPAIMKDKPSFVAVGALHLGGDVGILNQLEKMGYTVEAVD